MKTKQYKECKMEKCIKSKLSDHQHGFKQELHKWMEGMVLNDDKGVDRTQDFLKYLYDFPVVELSKDDFKRRTRVKNPIPNYDRCCALRLNGERCTRKRKEGEYCGTHLKGLPYGVISEPLQNQTEKVDVWLEDICGIHQYIDSFGNIYSTEDIINSVKAPRIISKYKKNEEGEYTLLN